MIKEMGLYCVKLNELKNLLHIVFMIEGKNDLVELFFLLFSFKVSWIRRKDYHLLTVGLTTYSSDERFSTIHLQHSEVSLFFLFK